MQEWAHADVLKGKTRLWAVGWSLRIPGTGTAASALYGRIGSRERLSRGYFRIGGDTPAAATWAYWRITADRCGGRPPNMISGPGHTRHLHLGDFRPDHYETASSL